MMAVGGSKVRADVGRPLVFQNGVVRVSLQESHPALALDAPMWLSADLRELRGSGSFMDIDPAKGGVKPRLLWSYGVTRLRKWLRKMA